MALQPIGTGSNLIFDKIKFIAVHNLIASPTDNGGVLADYEVGKYIPAIINDTVDFSGDEATTDNLLSIDGKVITPIESSAATFSVTAVGAALQSDVLSTLFGIDPASTAQSTNIFGESGTALSLYNLPTSITRTDVPISLISSNGKAVIFLPAATINAQLTYESDVVAFSMTITAVTFNGSMLKDINLITSDRSFASGQSLKLDAGDTITVGSGVDVSVNKAGSSSSKSASNSSL